LSGELHGNERVGPTAVMETARLLLEAASCEATVQMDMRSNVTLHTQQLTQYQKCSSVLLEQYGMTLAQQRWLAHLVTTRRILVVPTANALGYFRNSRMEDTVDPNRDFPHGMLSQDRDLCMRSIAARTMNELFRQYLIQNSLTFHGGTELLGYEWGTPSHFGSVSPDDLAQDRLARAYATYGGGFMGTNGRDHPSYMYGDMNSIIYYVRGGFEDFAYAGSWDHEHMVQCEPTTYGGYSVEKTQYDTGMLRSFNMLVETSFRKTPLENDLGTTWHVMNQNSEDPTLTRQRHLSKNNKELRNLRGGAYWPHSVSRLANIDRPANGHIPRNVRLALASIDMLQPYLSVTQINSLTLSDTLGPPPSTPSSLSAHSACTSRKLVLDDVLGMTEQATKTGAVPLVQIVINTTNLESQIQLHWTVGGAITVDQTQLWIAGVGTADDLLIADASAWLNDYICGDAAVETTSRAKRLEPNSIKSIFQSLGNSQQSGTGFFSAYVSQPVPPADGPTLGPHFTAPINLAQLNVAIGDMLVVLVSARVDSEWSELPFDAPVSPTNIGPQSHMVQSRTNASWVFENRSQGHIIQGQDQFFSRPVLIHIVESTDNDTDSETTLMNDRFQPIKVEDNVVVQKMSLSVENGPEQHTMAATETIVPSFFDVSLNPSDKVVVGSWTTTSPTATTIDMTEAPTFDATNINTAEPMRISKDHSSTQEASVPPPPESLAAFGSRWNEKEDKDNGEDKRRKLHQYLFLEGDASYVQQRIRRLQDHSLQPRP